MGNAPKQGQVTVLSTDSIQVRIENDKTSGFIQEKPTYHA
jgi:hypothetical protein